MVRKKRELYPDYYAFVEEIDKNGINPALLHEIIQRHKANALFNRRLYQRYVGVWEGVPIFDRQPRFQETDAINNKLNNDFFSEIVDFKTGFFAGNPIAYSYSKSKESEMITGGEEPVKAAGKAVTDFTTRNNMYGVDMEITKLASIYGYAGRLFYIDPEGNERVMPVQSFETIILSETHITEPKYALRYFENEDINGKKSWTVEFYDNAYIYTYTGMLSALKLTEQRLHMFDFCPLQGVANNSEMTGDAEKVLTLINDYNKVLSDNSNEIEAFVHAYLIFDGMRIDGETIEQGQKSGSFIFPPSGSGIGQGKAYFLTKDINDAFTEHHLKRLEDNIYRFSKTPNLADENFGQATGVAMKFKLNGLESKCGMYQAQMMNAAQHMWKLLSSAWRKKGITVDPLQCIMEFKRNFPLDLASEAQTVQALIAAGIPKEIAFAQLSFVDDVDYVMEMIEQEMQNITSLADTVPEDEGDTDTATK